MIEVSLMVERAADHLVHGDFGGSTGSVSMIVVPHRRWQDGQRIAAGVAVGTAIDQIIVT